MNCRSAAVKPNVILELSEWTENWYSDRFWGGEYEFEG